MNSAALSIIRKIKRYEAALIDDGSHRRYISAMWYDGVINGRAGKRRYIGYTLKEAVKLYAVAWKPRRSESQSYMPPCAEELRRRDLSGPLTIAIIPQFAHDCK